jgi:hypothetical protein
MASQRRPCSRPCRTCPSARLNLPSIAQDRARPGPAPLPRLRNHCVAMHLHVLLLPMPCVKVTDGRVTLIMALPLPAGNLQRIGAIPTPVRVRCATASSSLANGKPASRVTCWLQRRNG